MKQLVAALLKSSTESLRGLLPIIAGIALFQLVVPQQPIPDFGKILMGTLSVITGLTLFVRGLEFGRLALGFGATVAKPALIAVSEEAAEVAAVGGWISVTSEAKHE